MDYTDIILYFLSIIFLIRGALRGFMKSLLVPFSIIVATILSVIYFAITKELILSLVIGLIGPFVLHAVLRRLLKEFAKATNTEIKPDFLSRVGGAFLTLAWGWVFIAFTLILLAVLPPWGEKMKFIQHDVLSSATYSMVKPWGEHFFGGKEQTVDSGETPTSSANDTQSLAEDPRFQEVLKDPEIQKDIDTRNMVKLMSNPKMMALTREIMSDPATLKKVMAIYSAQAQPQGYFAPQNGRVQIYSTNSTN